MRRRRHNFCWAQSSAHCPLVRLGELTLERWLNRRCSQMLRVQVHETLQMLLQVGRTHARNGETIAVA